MRFLCKECGENFKPEKVIRYTDRALDGVRKYLQARCPSCTSWVTVEGIPNEAKVTAPAAYNRPTKRLLGSDIKIVGRTKWEDKPSDLVEKLEEEKRLRALREQDVKQSEELYPEGCGGESVD